MSRYGQDHMTSSENTYEPLMLIQCETEPSDDLTAPARTFTFCSTFLIRHSNTATATSCLWLSITIWTSTAVLPVFHLTNNLRHSTTRLFSLALTSHPLAFICNPDFCGLAPLATWNLKGNISIVWKETQFMFRMKSLMIWGGGVMSHPWEAPPPVLWAGAVHQGPWARTCDETSFSARANCTCAVWRDLRHTSAKGQRLMCNKRCSGAPKASQPLKLLTAPSIFWGWCREGHKEQLRRDIWAWTGSSRGLWTVTFVLHEEVWHPPPPLLFTSQAELPPNSLLAWPGAVCQPSSLLSTSVSTLLFLHSRVFSGFLPLSTSVSLISPLCLPAVIYVVVSMERWIRASKAPLLTATSSVLRTLLDNSSTSVYRPIGALVCKLKRVKLPSWVIWPHFICDDCTCWSEWEPEPVGLHATLAASQKEHQVLSVNTTCHVASNQTCMEYLGALWVPHLHQPTARDER